MYSSFHDHRTLVRPFVWLAGWLAIAPSPTIGVQQLSRPRALVLRLSPVQISPSGALTILQVPDYETHTRLNVTVRATDTCDPALFTDVVVVVGIVGLNEPPTLTCLAVSVISVRTGAACGCLYVYMLVCSSHCQAFRADYPPAHPPTHFLASQHPRVTPASLAAALYDSLLDT